MLFNITYTIRRHVFAVQIVGAMFIFAIIAISGV